MKKLLLQLLIISSLISFGQTDNLEYLSYKKKYSDKMAVKIKDITNVNITVDKKKGLLITTTTTSENIYLDKHANNFSEESVSSSYFDKIIDIEASSFEPISEKKYKEHKVKEFKTKRVLSSSIFYDENQTMSFFYPYLKEGSKSRLQYVTESTTPQLISGAYFGGFIDIEYSEFTVSHPSSIKMSFNKYNGADTLLQYTRTEKKGIITHKWSVKNLKPIKREGGTPSVLRLIPHVYPIINSYEQDGKTVELLGNVDDLHNWYTELLHKMKKDEDYTELQNVVDSLVKGKETDLDKVEAIFEYAQKDIKYVAYEDGLGGFVPRSPMTVFERRYGDCKDMSSLQVKMMELASIKGNVAWVGTRSKPYTYEEMPTPACDNHMIAVYKATDGKWYILDATGTYSPFGYPSEFIQEKELLIHLSDTTYEVYKVEIVESNRNLIKDVVNLTLDKDTLKGNGVAYLTGYQFADMKYGVMDKDSTQRSNRLKSKFEKGNNKFFFELDSLDIQGSSQGSVTYSFKIEDYVKVNGDEIYLNMNLQRLLSTEKMEDDRENDLELDFLREYDFQFIFDLEKKYKVDYIPENKSFSSKGFNYNLTYEQKDGKIYYRLNIKVDQLIIKKEDFKDWNDMVKSLNKKYKEVIILKNK